jgi:tetratricopeptide (TPR) repeat protein/predicted Ser/Thr protein kinase
MASNYAGMTFGRRYHLLDSLGAGGMGEVYRARDQRLERDVAIKVIKGGGTDDEERGRRLQREANILSKLNHQNIAAIYDMDREDDVDYVVMELVEGETLSERIRVAPLDEEEILRVGMQIAAGLAEAHEHGVVHRDLKPGNIMLTPKGQLKLLDFGLARLVEPNALTATVSDTGANVSGTFPYMAPEQLRGQPVGPPTDIWALGVVLYEMASGRRPFGGDDIASIVDGIVNRTPEPLSSIRGSLAPGLSFIVQKCLSKAPSERYQSAAELGAALQALRSGSWSGAKFAPAKGGTGVSAGMLRAAAAAVTVVALAASIWWVTRPPATAPVDGPEVSVLVGGVENRTGDPAYDDLLPELLTTTLEQSRTIDVYPRSNLGYVLRRMQLDPATPVNEVVGREIAQREGLSAVLLQSITRLGDSLVLVVRAVMPDGKLLASTQEALGSPTELPGRMDAVGKAMRQALGESAATVQTAAKLEEVTSKSLEAVQFYSRGRQRILAGDPRGSLVFLQRAIELDPEFAMAHASMGAAYTNLLDPVRAEQHFKIAAAFAARAPEIEREKLLGDFAMIRRNYDAACPHYEVLSSMRPRDTSALLMLGYCSALKLDFTTAVSVTEKAHQVQPSTRSQINRALIAFLSGNLQLAVDEAEAVRKAVPGLVQAGYVAGKARLALGQFDQARAIYQSMVAQGGDAAVEGHMGLADVARSTGRQAAALTEWRQAHMAATQIGNLSVATSAAAAEAELALLDGRQQEFRAALARVTAIPPDVYLAYRVGRARARGGLFAEAAEAIKAIDALRTGPSRQHDALKALLRAEIALARSQPAAAVEEAQAAVRFEASTVAHETLARAFIAHNRGADAVRSFEHIVAHPAERCDSYDSPACFRNIEALYWVGRLKDDAGDRAGAEPFLKQFVSAWSGAPAQEMLNDAMKRLAR